MNQQRNKYNGEIDRETKQRDGYGIYQYPNEFFQFQGNYLQGLKEGKGKLVMKDGTTIEGQFQQDELMGYGEMTCPNGNYYKGEYMQGDKHGQGEWLFRGDLYQGQFVANCKTGKGQLKKINGDNIQGQFMDNKMHGEVEIMYGNGDSYVGQMVMSMREGEGVYWQQDGQVRYEGGYKNDMREGKGIEVFGQEYRYNGCWEQDQKIDYPNQIRVTNSGGGFEYELGGPSMQVVMQFEYKGQDQIDPNQPTEEEIQLQMETFQKENKKNKSTQQATIPDFHAPRLIESNPIIRDEEDGRHVQVLFYLAVDDKDIDYLGSQKPILFDYREQLAVKRLDNSRLKQQILDAQAQTNEQSDANDYKAKKKERANKELLSQQINMDDLEQTKVYEEVQNLPVDDYVLTSVGGVVDLGLIEFPSDFPAGRYMLLFKDVTDLRAGDRMPSIQHELIVKVNAEKAKDKKKK